MENSGDNAIHIALVSDRRYLPGLLATLSSMVLAAGEKARLRFHVVADGFGEADERAVTGLAARCGAPDSVEFLKPDVERIRKSFGPWKNSHTTFMRLYLCELLPDLDWILYADVDTLWFRDPCALWEERDPSVSLAWCPDCPSIARWVRGYSLGFNPRFDVDRYACSGVILMNLERMRKTGFVVKCEEFAAKWGTQGFADQDILNTLCLDDAKLLDRRWNCMMPDRAAVDGVVIHCNGIGGQFDIPMKRWRPSYYVWHRFYADVVLGVPDRPAASRLRRLFFWALGFFYPPHRAIAFLSRPFGRFRADQIERTLFFAWLWRRAKWWRKWNGNGKKEKT